MLERSSLRMCLCFFGLFEHFSYVLGTLPVDSDIGLGDLPNGPPPMKLFTHLVLVPLPTQDHPEGLWRSQVMVLQRVPLRTCI